MNSEQGFPNVPGVPDGWELVHCLRIGEPGEIGLNQLGEPFAIGPNRTIKKIPIIRKVKESKIEQPAKYRPFANADEFRPNVGRYVEVVKETSECEMDRGDTLLIVGVSYDSVLLYGGWITFKAAFECLVFGDGTPFGVKVEE